MAWCAAEMKPSTALPRLLDAFLGKGAHFGGNLETVAGGHDHLL